MGAVSGASGKDVTERMVAAGEETISSIVGSRLPTYLSAADLAVRVYLAMATAGSIKL
jgi:hypothetical protein